MKLLRRIIQWVVVPVVVIGLIGALYLEGRVDEEIRHQVERKFAEHYRDLKVRVHAARLLPGEGIEVRGLSISLPNSNDDQGELLYVDELFVRCNTELDRLVQQDLGIQHLVIRRPIIRATPDAEGHWNVAKLLPLPKFGGQPPSGEFEHATIELADPESGVGRTMVVRDLNFKFRPERNARDPSRYDFVVDGRLAADFTRSTAFQGKFAADGKSWHMQGSIAGMEFCPELCQALPGMLAKKFLPLASMRAQVNAEYHLAYDAAKPERWNYAISGAVAQGRIDDARLPYPLTDLTAVFECDNQGCSVHELTARNGPTTLSLSMERVGHQPGAPWTLVAESRQMVLDQQLFRALPPAFRDEWRKFLPEGKVDARLRLHFDGQTYHPDVTVQCLGVSFYYQKFPYRLEGATGTITFKDEQLKARLTAYSGRRELRIDGELLHPGPQGTGWLKVVANDLPLDEKLFAALNPGARQVIKELRPDGTIDLDLLFRREPGGGAGFQRSINVVFNRCAVRYLHFPYPIQDIRGRMTINDDEWKFEQLEGSNDTGRVYCQGHFRPVGNGEKELWLEFAAENVPLETELRDALRPAMQRIWSDMRPQGAIGLSAKVRYLTQGKRLDVAVRGEASPDETSMPVSIEPVYFPYRLERLQGTFDYHNGHVDLTNLRARHGQTTVSAGGKCDLALDGSWQLTLSPLVVDGMRLDRELVQALPERLAQGIDELKPDGTMSLSGKLGFSGSGLPQEPLKTDWDVQLDLHRVAMQCGVSLENIHGGVRLWGATNKEEFQSRGELKLDSVTYEDFQLTDVRGPLLMDDKGVLLGRWAERGQPVTNARRITANCYGGKISGDAWSTRGAPNRFQVYAELADADLRRITGERFPGRQNLRGRVDGQVNLQGAGRGWHNLSGQGSLQLREADIYEMPQMVQLLSILRLKTPSQTAFTNSEVDFELDGGRYYFKRLQFVGDALSLYGRGEMDLERNVTANFYTMVGAHRIPGLSDLMGSASQQIMLVRATGPLDQLSITNEVFPGVNEFLQQLQSDLQVPLAGAATTVPAPGTGAARREGAESSRLWGLFR
ncbi:MAG: AsmA-like C-terminal region-containing protein [Planctomycetia bacterium]|nr:AsmA-like C-terminal region-containing protein [Planctomycetia bacterium]